MQTKKNKRVSDSTESLNLQLTCAVAQITSKLFGGCTVSNYFVLMLQFQDQQESFVSPTFYIFINICFFIAISVIGKIVIGGVDFID